MKTVETHQTETDDVCRLDAMRQADGIHIRPSCEGMKIYFVASGTIVHERLVTR